MFLVVHFLNKEDIDVRSVVPASWVRQTKKNHYEGFWHCPESDNNIPSCVEPKELEGTWSACRLVTSNR